MIGIENISNVLLFDTLAEISLPPYAFWNPNGISVTDWTNGSTWTLLGWPYGISITDKDILYISDTNHHRVLVVDLVTGKNLSVIGSGLGNNPNQFYSPYDIFATNTSLYVIDYLNYRVQKTSLTGSNPSTVLALNLVVLPYYLYVDKDDNLYLSDTWHHRILRYPANSTVSTMVAGTAILGTSTRQLYLPYGIFVNEIGTIYIADNFNHRIMKWFSGASTGIIAAGTGVFGTSSAQVNYPTQVVVDTNDYMYISEAGTSRITRWAPGSSAGECIAACSGIAGSTSAQLYSPYSLAFDSNGSLYVSDHFNMRIQKFKTFKYSTNSKCSTYSHIVNSIHLIVALFLDP